MGLPFSIHINLNASGVFTVKNSNKWLYHNFSPSHKILLGLSSFVCEKFSLRSESLTFLLRCVLVALPSLLEKAAALGKEHGIAQREP